MKYTLLAILFSLLWATAFIGVKFGLRSSPPLFLMGSRFLLAAVLLMSWARLRGVPRPQGRDWWRLAVLGLFNHAGYLGLAGMSMRSLSSGMGAILASANPLMLALVAPWLLQERMSTKRVIGLVLAFGSVAAIMYARTGGGIDSPTAMVVMFLGNSLLVAGTVLFKRWSQQAHLAHINGVQLLSAAVALLIPSLLFEPVASLRLDANYLGTLLYLTLGISGGAMLIWFYLLRVGEAARASSFLFLNPVFGIFLGNLVLGEPLRPFDMVGTAGVALGIWLVQKNPESV